MNYAIEGIYKNGNIELAATPQFQKPVGVVVIFLNTQNKIKKLNGIFKHFTVNYDQIEQDLKELNRNSSTHLLEESGSDL